MLVDVNGTIVSHDTLALPVTGPPTGLSNGVYETMRVYPGARRPFLLRQHLYRLATAARFLGCAMMPPGVDWEQRIEGVLRANQIAGTDVRVRIMLFRDAGPHRPGECIVASQVDTSALYAKQQKGIGALLAARRRKPDAELFKHKTLSLHGTKVAVEEAAKRGYSDTIFLNERDEVCEGSFSNVFAVVDDQLITPPVSSPCLPGITRHVVREIATAEGLTVTEEPLLLKTLAEASEVFLTSSVSEIVPVLKVERYPIAKGEVGPVTRRLQGAYHRWVSALK